MPVLSGIAHTLYAAATRDGHLDPAAVAAAGADGESAVRQLLELGLLRHGGAGTTHLVPIDPRLIEARLGATWRTAAVRLLEQADDLAQIIAPMSEAFQVTGSVEDDSGAVRHLEGKSVIGACIEEAVSNCRKELLTAQPGGRRPEAVLAGVRKSTAELLAREVSVKTLYQHTARHDRATRGYVEDVAALGAEVRTLDEFFDRLILVDRHTAFLPASEDRSRAVVVKDAAVVHFLADVFDRNWHRAAPFGGQHSPKDSVAVSTRLRETILRCLIDGESDVSIARRIGLSARAYASHVAKLKTEFEAETRFQLGYRLARQEWERRSCGGPPGGSGGDLA
jgi:DNA-binding CsgD family transcriptional regulator